MKNSTKPTILSGGNKVKFRLSMISNKPKADTKATTTSINNNPVIKTVGKNKTFLQSNKIFVK